MKRLRAEQGISQDRLSKLADLSLNTVVTVKSGSIWPPNPAFWPLIPINLATHLKIISDV